MAPSICMVPDILEFKLIPVQEAQLSLVLAKSGKMGLGNDIL